VAAVAIVLGGGGEREKTVAADEEGVRKGSRRKTQIDETGIKKS
jgi:hypothetical protein